MFVDGTKEGEPKLCQADKDIRDPSFTIHWWQIIFLTKTLMCKRVKEGRDSFISLSKLKVIALEYKGCTLLYALQRVGLLGDKFHYS